MAGVATAALAGISSNLRGVIADLGDLQDAADRMDLRPEQLQGLQAGFKLGGVDIAATTQSLEIFTQRIGEAANGEGALYATLRRSGVALRDQNGDVRSTIDLLRDFADVLQAAPSDAERLALAVDAFGKAGRPMVNALAGGAGAIDEMIAKAREAGLVLDDALVAKAAELDDKFDIMTMRIATYWKRLAVGAAAALDSVATLSDEEKRYGTGPGPGQIVRIADEFVASPRGANILGPEVIASIKANDDAFREHASEVLALGAAYDDASVRAEGLATGLVDLGLELQGVGEAQAGQKIRALGAAMYDLVLAFDADELSAATFEAALLSLMGQASDTVDELGTVDGVTFDAVKAQLGSVGGVLATLIGLATAFRNALPGPGTVKPDNSGELRHAQEYRAVAAKRKVTDEFLVGQAEINRLSQAELDIRSATTAKLKEAKAAGVDISEQQARDLALAEMVADGIRRGAVPTSSGGGGGGGGRAAPVDEFAKAIGKTREETTSLLAELEALTGGTDAYGRSADYAAKRAELLASAQRAGMEITPELEQQVNDLAAAYDKAGQSVTDMQDDLAAAEDAGRSLFVGLATGTKTWQQALSDLLASVADQLANSVFDQFWGSGGGGLGGIIGGLFGDLFGGLSGGSAPRTSPRPTPRPPAFAGGVRNFDGGQAVINERGGELVVLPGGSTVVPHDLSKRMVGGDASLSQGLTLLDRLNGILGTLFGGRVASRAVPAFAGGVRNFDGGQAVINERGGELVVLPGGSTVVPHDLSKSMVGGDASLSQGLAMLGRMVSGPMQMMQGLAAQFDRTLDRGPAGGDMVFHQSFEVTIPGGSADQADDIVAKLRPAMAATAREVFANIRRRDRS